MYEFFPVIIKKLEFAVLQIKPSTGIAGIIEYSNIIANGFQ